MAIKPTFKDGLIISVQQMERVQAAAAHTYGLFADEGAVTTSANLAVAVAAIAAGSYVINDVIIDTAYSASTVTSDAAHGSNPRIDTVVINTSGSVSIVKGDAAADPEPKDVASTELVLSFLYLAQNDTAYATGDIFDRRQIIGQRRGRKGADVAATAALPILTDDYFDVTGTTTITSIKQRPAGWEVTCQFDATLTITHHATSMILAGGADLEVGAGDTVTFRSEGSGNYREVGSNVSATLFQPAQLLNTEIFVARGGTVPFTGGVWSLANLAIYTPIVISRATTIRKLHLYNGSAVRGTST